MPKTDARTIGEQWASYQAEVVPTVASDVQREECKRAFYAGANAMFSAVMAAMAYDDTAAAARLQALDREMRDFIRLFAKRENV